MNASGVGELFATVTGHHPNAITTHTMDTATDAEKHESLKYSNAKKVNAIQTTADEARLLHHLRQQIHAKRSKTMRKILGILILLLERVSSMFENRDTDEIRKQRAHLIRTRKTVDEKITETVARQG